MYLEANETPFEECTPYELLSIKAVWALFVDKSDKGSATHELGLARIDAVNHELTRRGRCTICGLKHLTMYHAPMED